MTFDKYTIKAQEAVQEAVNYVINKAINNDKISSEMVRRNSCGCQGNSKLKTISFGRISDDPEAFARRMSQFLFNKYSASETTAKNCAKATSLST